MTNLDLTQCTALVVDDDEFSRDFIENVLLTIHCAQVWKASDPVEALDLVRNHQPDFVFLDIYMPDTDGWALLDKIRRTRPSTAVIMITGSNLPADFGKSMGKQVDGYCIKPVLPDVMHKLMHKASLRRFH